MEQSHQHSKRRIFVAKSLNPYGIAVISGLAYGGEVNQWEFLEGEFNFGELGDKFANSLP